MAIQIGGTSVIDNDRKGIFQSANVGSFDNPSRPGSPTTGDVIFSTTDNELQVWDGTQWITATGISSITATGGTILTSPSLNHRTHVFDSPGTFTLSQPAVVDYVLVAGGGAGGVGLFDLVDPFFAQGSLKLGGGGGAGGVIKEQGITLTAGDYPITVGAGGGNLYFSGGAEPTNAPGIVATSTPGGNSTFNGNTAIGGGPGGSLYPPAPVMPQFPGAIRFNGYPGGSGGGGYEGGTPGVPAPQQASDGGAGTPGQGFPGSPGGPAAGPAAGGGGGGAGGTAPPSGIAPTPTVGNYGGPGVTGYGEGTTPTKFGTFYSVPQHGGEIITALPTTGLPLLPTAKVGPVGFAMYVGGGGSTNVDTDFCPPASFVRVRGGQGVGNGPLGGGSATSVAGGENFNGGARTGGGGGGIAKDLADAGSWTFPAIITNSRAAGGSGVCIISYYLYQE